MLPTSFAAVPPRTKNLTEVVRRAAGKQTAYVAITTEQRTDHAEAVSRLLEIANEADGKRTFTAICGWPALERLYIRKLAHLQSEGENGEPAEREAKPAPAVPAVTVAVAQGDEVVRFEGVLTEGASPEGLAEILGFAQSMTCPANPQPEEARQTSKRLQQQLQLKPQALPPPAATPVIKPEQAAQLHRPLQFSPTTANPNFALGPSGAELQIATSSTGQVVVIGSNNGTSFSNDYADSFGASKVPAGINKGDPVLGTGASGQFYLGGMSFNAAGCDDVVAVDTAKTGANFAFQGNAVHCPITGAICVPDQPQMAVDSQNATPTGDQLYMVWRNFPDDGSKQCSLIGSGNPTPTIACSVDGGQTWQNQTAVGTGDRARIAVGSDGFVYVTYVIGLELGINKFSSCAKGLQPQPHFPAKIAAFSGVDCPIDGLFTSSSRCTYESAASPQPAVSQEFAGDVLVSYAERINDQNDDIVVRHSHDGGLSWPDRVVANTAVNAHRFMPWICTTGGIANVSWYDRRAATSQDDSLTNYYFSQLSLRTSPPSLIGSDQNISVSTDSQKSVTITGDPKFGDYNGNTCANNRAFLAWASATPPPGITNPGGIQVYAAATPPGPPIVSSVTPSGGKCNTGTTITISGSNFYNVSGVSAVPQDLVYQGTALPFTVVSHSQITANVPATLPSMSYEIVVETPSGLSSQPTPPRTDLFGIGPTITSLSPNTGPVPGGTEVTITGTCFDSHGLNPNKVQVYFGGVQASKGFDQCASSTQCVVYSPPASGVRQVEVVVNVDGANSVANFPADLFTYAGPHITGVTPNHGPKTGGTSVLITGDGFPPYTGTPNNLSVFFGPVPAGALCLGSTLYATTSCEVDSPAAGTAGAVDVVAHAFGASSSTSAADVFTYDEYPALVNLRLPDPFFGVESAVFLNGNAPPGGAAVSLTSSDTSVVQLPQPTVTIAAGSQSAFVPLTILPTAETKQVVLTATYQGSSVNATLPVYASPPLSLITPTNLAANQSGSVEVSLNTPAPAGGALVSLTCSDPSAIVLPTTNSVTVPAGSYSTSFSITNTYSGKPKSVKISGTYNGASASDAILVPSTPCQEKKCPRGSWWDESQCFCNHGPPE